MYTDASDAIWIKKKSEEGKENISKSIPAGREKFRRLSLEELGICINSNTEAKQTLESDILPYYHARDSTYNRPNGNEQRFIRMRWKKEYRRDTFWAVWMWIG